MRQRGVSLVIPPDPPLRWEIPVTPSWQGVRRRHVEGQEPSALSAAWGRWTGVPTGCVHQAGSGRGILPRRVCLDKRTCESV